MNERTPPVGAGRTRSARPHLRRVLATPGWAPQIWKKFDPDATAADLARMKQLEVNCVRVFLTYGSFVWEQDALSAERPAKFEEFLAQAERAGIYVHPTGPDHWEGLPDWVQGDRTADEAVISALERFCSNVR